MNKNDKPPASDWYIDIGKSIGGKLRGYFKFIVKLEDESAQIYHVWWAGLNDEITITKHDLPKAEYEKYKDAIAKTAKQDSLRVYRNVMMSYWHK